MKHEPDPEFLDHLEWQMETALRRRDRFARPVPTGALRVARTLALVLLCVSSGAGLVIGAERIQQSREAELLLKQNRIQLTLADRQLDRASGQLARLSVLHESGRIDQTSLWSAEREVLLAERARQHLTLDREEIEASGRAPNREITAPRVGGRDFLSEHWQLELDTRAEEVREAQQRLERTGILVSSGLTSSAERDHDLLELQRLELRLQRVRSRLELRAEHLAGRLDARETRRQDRIGEVDFRRAESVMEIEVLERLLERARLRAQAGVTGPGEVADLELELEEHQADLELAELERSLLEEQE